MLRCRVCFLCARTAQDCAAVRCIGIAAAPHVLRPTSVFRDLHFDIVSKYPVRAVKNVAMPE
eukprot:1793653-Pleurochrysis_carterae.AAC.1